MAERLRLALLDEPRLYVYIGHGGNLRKAGHVCARKPPIARAASFGLQRVIIRADTSGG